MTCLAAAPPRSWRDGPVRYLLSDEEHQAYGKLTSDEARAAFVERFWARLDPDPATAENEFRETYEARCAAASERFEAIRGPAWATDRGRVFLLLGEPKGVRRETAGLLAVEKEVWVYATGDGPSGTEIPFFRCPDGAYRLDPACPPVDRRSASSEWFRTNAERWKTFAAGVPTRREIEDLVGTIAARDAPGRPREDARAAVSGAFRIVAR